MKSVLAFVWLVCVIAYPAHTAGVTLRVHDRVARTIDLAWEDETGATHRKPMTRAERGFWQVNVPLPPGEYRYQFIMDDAYSVSDMNNPDYHRHDDGSVISILHVREDDTSSQETIAEPDPVKHYPVHVEHWAPHAERVDLAGEFSTWHPLPMHRVGNGVWRATVELPEGRHAYKFIVDGEWIMDPAHEGVKEVDGILNSALVAPSAPDAYKVAQTVEETAPPAVEGAIPVHVAVYAPLAERVSLVGTMNDWNDTAHPMILNESGMWEGVFSILPSTYEYKFKVDDMWWRDLRNPYVKDGGEPQNSIMEVRADPPITGARQPLPVKRLKEEQRPIAFQAGTWLHPVQQELLRAFLYHGLADGHGLSVRDGTLLHPLDIDAPDEEVTTLYWAIEMINGRPYMRLGLEDDLQYFPFHHPLTAPPLDWLDELRAITKALLSNLPKDWTDAEYAPEESLWEEALATRDSLLPFSGVQAVNMMTDYGRDHGWSRALLRDIAVTYADLAHDFSVPSLGGQSVPVFAARAVAYADRARGDAERDETLAYVLARIGRPGDGLALSPDEPETLIGQIGRALARHDRDFLLELLDNAELIRPADKARVRLALTDLQQADRQRATALTTINAHMRAFPHDLHAGLRLRGVGGVSSGHRYVEHLLALAADPALWQSILDGDSPSLTPLPRSASFGEVRIDPLESHLPDTTERARTALAEGLDRDDGAIPQMARWLLLRDTLDATWWNAANFYGRQLSSGAASDRLLERFAPWAEIRPTMALFVRTQLHHPRQDHEYSAMRAGLTEAGLEPHSMSLMRMVHQTYRMWSFDFEFANTFYRMTPYVKSDLVQDHVNGRVIFAQANTVNHRARMRALDPMSARGYTENARAIGPEAVPSLPESVERSYDFHWRMGRSWKRGTSPEATDNAVTFFERAMAIQPGEPGPYRELIDLYIDREEYEEASRLVRAFPDTTEGLHRVAAERMGVWGALGMGDVEEAKRLAHSAARSWQAAALRHAGMLFEILGELDEAERYLNRLDSRYNQNHSHYFYLRHNPDKGRALIEQELEWADFLTDDQLRGPNRYFSFNRHIPTPYYYWAIGNPERALWFIREQAEAVQNDYTWFTLMTLGYLLDDQHAFELGRHVLSDHVDNAYGEFARYLRGERTWHEVVSALERHTTGDQDLYTFAALLAEDRGDKELALRFRYHVLTPPRGGRALYTMAWQAIHEQGRDPYDVLKARYLPEQEVITQEDDAIEGTPTAED